MTDAELAKFLGIDDDERWPQAIAKMDPVKRQSYERMADVVAQVQLYDSGLGPKPPGVIVCYDHRRKK